MQVPIEEINIKEGRRRSDACHVRELADSIRELGLLNPVTIDKEKNLIAGLHRLEAARLLGWTEVKCIVSSLEGLKAELAEIDENIVRSGLSAVEYGETLLRRKEIYEALHPETKAGVSQAAGMNRAIGNNVAEKISATTKSFVDDTAEKLGVTPRTVRGQIQMAKNLTADAKEIIRGSDAKITKKDAMKLSRMEPGQQKEAAALLAAKEIKSVDEYAKKAEREEKEKISAKKTEPAEKEAGQGKARGMRGNGTNEPGQEPPGGAGECKPEQTGQDGKTAEDASGSGLPAAREGASLKEIVADLKNADKDCSGTPASFLAEFDAFVKKFRREIGWYDDPYYDPVFRRLTGGQLADFRRQADSIHAAVEKLYGKIERMMRDGKQ